MSILSLILGGEGESGASQHGVFLEPIFFLHGGDFQKGSWNEGSLMPNGPEKGFAAGVLL